MNTFDRFQTGKDDHGRRLDRIIRRLYPELSLSVIYRMFRTGSILLSGKKAQGANLIKAGDEITVKRSNLMSAKLSPDKSIISTPPDVSKNLSLIFQSYIIRSTPDLIIINKPKGILAHGSEGLDEMVTAFFSGKLAASLAFRPAPLHRLDRNTSGALAISASLTGARVFSSALREGLIGKEYLAVLDGLLEGELCMKDHLTRDIKALKSSVSGDNSGAYAETNLFPIARGTRHTLVAIRISTGLTHQIRVQCAHHGYPLAGDKKYGGSSRHSGYLLHCACLEFPDGFGLDFPKKVTAPLPSPFLSSLKGIFAPRSLDSEDLQRYF